MNAREQRIAELVAARARLDANIVAIARREGTRAARELATPGITRRQRATMLAREARRPARLLAVFHPRHTPYGDTPESQWANLVALDLGETPILHTRAPEEARP